MTTTHVVEGVNPSVQYPWVVVLVQRCFKPNVSPSQSLADRCKKIHAGDEVIQVNHQTVVGALITYHTTPRG